MSRASFSREYKKSSLDFLTCAVYRKHNAQFTHSIEQDQIRSYSRSVYKRSVVFS